MTDMRGVTVSIEQLIAQRAAAKRLNLQRRRFVAIEQQGDVVSKLRGRGMDFAEVRAYQAGDDIRHMDWRVTARTGSPHTKIYCEERERPVYIVVDFASSLFFGTQVAFKSVIAAQVAALLAWATLHSGDRLGAFIMAPNATKELHPRRRETAVMAFLQQLVEFAKPNREPNAAADSVAHYQAQMLLRLRRVVKPGSLIFLISDFTPSWQETEVARHLSYLTRHSELIACRLKDPLEVQLPPAGRYGMSDGRQFWQWDCATSEMRQRYADWQTEQLAASKNFLQQHKIILLDLLTSDAIVEKLQSRLRYVA